MSYLKKRNEPIPKRNKRGFNYSLYRWQKYSIQYRKLNPLCVMCLKEGITHKSECTDHITPIEEGGDIWNPDNHQALCLRHHNSKTARETKNINQYE